MANLVFKVHSRTRYQASKFPLHLRPEEDELLSSWLIRLALLHHTMPCTFTNLFLPETRNKLWSADIDLQAAPAVLCALSDKSGLPVCKLHLMTLKSYEGYIFQQAFPKTKETQFINRTGMRGRRCRLPAFRYCPQCLKEDISPYLRKKWRLSFSTACLQHRCFLLDRCPQCDNAVTHYRKPLIGAFPNCDLCGFPLSEAEVEGIAQESYGLTAIQKIYSIIDSGFVIMNGVPIYSFLFFQVIHHLCKAAYSWNKTTGFLDHEIMLHQLSNLPWEQKAREVEDVRLKEQYLLFSGVMHFFDPYPGNFIDYCTRNRLGKTELSRDLRIPYWYCGILDRFDLKYWPVSDEEVRNATRFIQAHGMKQQLKALQELIGRRLDPRKRGRGRQI